ncbi:MAG: deoxyuridine 5'-triphosphate nucleotidohydrolase [Candidatus Omnitrophica bacterium]|nr:deoxyuridine 5'-triphosphate nucleotidohydrolase [Candidatus Omnitrophota bacterium]
MLNKSQIKQLIEEKELISGYVSPDKQLTPNGFDLTAGEISEFTSSGAVDFSNNERVLPETEKIIPKKKTETDEYGWWQLDRGIYKVKTNETVNMPNNLVAIAFTRTSLLRMGAFTQHGVWDAGFRGKSEFVLVVENPKGVQIKENARIAQLAFLSAQETESYNGIYKDLK